MLKNLLFSVRRPGSFWLALALPALCCHQAGAQATAPKDAWAWVRPGALVYLDGKPSTLAEVRRLESGAIFSASGLSLYSKDSLNQLFGGIIAQSAQVITTKANANSPAVLALADRLGLREGYTEQPAAVRAIAPKALAYITRHYPQCWLGGEVVARTQKSTGAVRYHVQLADRWGWRYVDFTPAGEVVENPLASPIAQLLVLTLGYPRATTQPTPATSRKYAPVYLDGQRSSPDALRTLSPDSVASVRELQEEVGQLVTPDAAGRGLLSIMTKQGQNKPAAVAFTKQMRQLEAIQRLAAHSHQGLAAPHGLFPAQQLGRAAEIRFYLNDELIAEETVARLDPNTLASVDLLQGEPAASYTHDPTAGGVVLFTTKRLPQAAAGSLRSRGKRVN